MALKGRAFLAMWHDITPEGTAEYNAWHTAQHMPERLGVPGFLLGRRYVDWGAARDRWFTLYEGATLESFASEDYRARLNAPTHWSGVVQPHFRNFSRTACVTAASVGRGVGGALATFRLVGAGDGLAGVEAGAAGAAHRIAALACVVGAHIGVAAPGTTKLRTRESEMRAAAEETVVDAVVMVEATGRRELGEAMPGIVAALGGVFAGGVPAADIYDLAYLLGPGD